MKAWIVAFAVTAGMSLGAFAEPPGRASGEDDGERGRSAGRAARGEAYRLMRSAFTVRIVQKLNLEDEQIVLLVSQIDRQRETMRDLGKERYRMVHALEAELEASKDAQAIAAKLDALMAHDKKMRTVAVDIFGELDKDFTSWQRAKFYLLMSRFESDMRELLEEAHRRRGGGEVQRMPGPRPGGLQRPAAGPGSVRGSRGGNGRGPRGPGGGPDAGAPAKPKTEAETEAP